MAEAVGSLYYEVEADTSKLVNSTKPLDKSLDGVNKQFKKTDRSADKFNTKMKTVSASVQQATRSGNGMTTAYKALGAAIAAIGVTRLFGSVAEAGLALDAINSSLRVATGSAEGAATEFQFLTQEADRLGLELRSSAKAYASLAAASKGTELQGQASRDIFIAVSEAMTALGRSSFETEGALTAIEQMISKGNVSAEELRGQLGERLPGAFQMAARSIGVTTEELDKMLSNGEVTATYMLPRLAKELRNTFSAEAERRANGLQAEINRFKNAVFDLQTSGNLDDMASALRDFTDLIKDPGFQKGFSALVGGMIKIATLAGKVASGFGDVGKMIGETTARMMGYETIVDQILSKEDELTQNQYQLTRARTASAKEAARVRIEETRKELEALRQLHAMQLQTASGGSEEVLEAGETEDQGSGGGADNDLGPAITIPEDTVTSVDLIADRYSELLDVAERLSEELRTPQEIYQQEIALLNELLNTRKKGTEEGIIDYETYVRGVVEAQERLVESTQDSTEEMSEFARQAARNMQDVFADFLFDPFEDGLDGMAKGFLDVTRRMVAEAAASQIFSAIGSGLSGTSFGSLLGSAFGGGRLAGGPVDAGKFYRINESGAPEILNTGGKQYLMMNGHSGNVQTMSKGSGAGGNNINVSVTVNSDGSLNTQSTAGYANFGREIGRIVESKVSEMFIEESRPGGLLKR